MKRIPTRWGFLETEQRAVNLKIDDLIPFEHGDFKSHAKITQLAPSKLPGYTVICIEVPMTAKEHKNLMDLVFGKGIELKNVEMTKDGREMFFGKDEVRKK